MTNVLIVEDQEMTRRLLELLLEGAAEYRVIRAIPNAEMALFYCDRGDVDLVLMDVCTEMDASGLDAAARIKEKHPDIKVIIVTSIPEFSWLERARAAGADSFWYKNVSRAPLIEIMDRTMRGESVYPDETPPVTIGLASSKEFSTRELEILRELTGGASNQEIGRALGISPLTVKTHVKNMLDKTGFHTRTELAVEARRLGLVIKDKPGNN